MSYLSILFLNVLNNATGLNKQNYTWARDVFNSTLFL